MVFDEPRLIYAFNVERKPYIRRFFWMLLAFVASASAWIVLDAVAGRERVDANLLRIGQSIALVLAIIFFFRTIIYLLRAIRTQNEAAQFFDRGFRWKIGKKDPVKYGWSQVKSFRQGARTVYVLRRPVLQYGAHVLTMRDGRVFKFTPRHGDTRKFAKAIRRPIAEITGTQIGRRLREKKGVRLHPELVLQPNGIVAGKHKIRWSNVDIKVTKTRLIVSQKNARGQFKTVKKYDIRKIDNITGFLDIAHSTIRNHQPERFNIKTFQPEL